MAFYNFDNQSLFKNEKRWFPIMGEIHYSRYPFEFWKEELFKMKEGGVDIVSSYVIWIHHEEIENEWDWSGDKNLRAFVEEIKNCGLKMFLRVGPWIHGEVRNGGFPDWLLKKCANCRTNDESYFLEVEKFYKEIYAQVEGLFEKDGGPIIGIQVENEYGHCGGLKGEEGEKYMERLTSMLKQIGFDVPLWTATGWGGAVTGGLLPVMGGYCDAPWDLSTEKLAPSGNYVFTHERNDHAIGCDFGIGEGITFDMKKFPYLTAELGGGLQVTYRRRPVSMPKDIGAMTLAKMGSGCNLLGYYMYHGGQNPQGKLSTLEENSATGYINDLPVKNYDFRAPLGQYGFTNGAYGEIKKYALFVHDFGEDFCSTKAFIPDENPLDPANVSDLRISWRYDENDPSKPGYVFVNNYVRLEKMAEHKDALFEAELKFSDGTTQKISFPKINVADGDYFFFPFNMKIGCSLLKTALATPLCILNNTEKTYVFYSPLCSQVKIFDAKTADKKIFQFEDAKDDSCKILLMPFDCALDAHKIVAEDKKEFLVLSKNQMYFDGKNIVFSKVQGSAVEFSSYPEISCGGNFEKTLENCIASYKEKILEAKGTAKINFEDVSSDEKKCVYKFTTENFEDAEDLVLRISYEGNCARLYEDGKLLDDSIFMGRDFEWTIGLKRYGKQVHHFTLEIDRLYKDAKVYLETPLEKDWACSLIEISAEKIHAVEQEIK